MYGKRKTMSRMSEAQQARLLKSELARVKSMEKDIASTRPDEVWRKRLRGRTFSSLRMKYR